MVMIFLYYAGNDLFCSTLVNEPSIYFKKIMLLDLVSSTFIDLKV